MGFHGARRIFFSPGKYVRRCAARLPRLSLAALLVHFVFFGGGSYGAVFAPQMGHTSHALGHFRLVELFSLPFWWTWTWYAVSLAFQRDLERCCHCVCLDYRGVSKKGCGKKIYMGWNDQMIANTTCKMDMLRFEAFIQQSDYLDSTWRIPGVGSIIRFNFPCFPLSVLGGGTSSKRETCFLLVGLDMCNTLAPGRGEATENAECCDAVRNAVPLASKAQKRKRKHNNKTMWQHIHCKHDDVKIPSSLDTASTVLLRLEVASGVVGKIQAVVNGSVKHLETLCKCSKFHIIGRWMGENFLSNAHTCTWSYITCKSYWNLARHVAALPAHSFGTRRLGHPRHTWESKLCAYCRHANLWWSCGTLYIYICQFYAACK